MMANSFNQGKLSKFVSVALLTAAALFPNNQILKDSTFLEQSKHMASSILNLDQDDFSSMSFRHVGNSAMQSRSATKSKVHFISFTEDGSQSGATREKTVPDKEQENVAKLLPGQQWLKSMEYRGARKLDVGDILMVSQCTPKGEVVCLELGQIKKCTEEDAGNSGPNNETDGYDYVRGIQTSSCVYSVLKPFTQKSERLLVSQGQLYLQVTKTDQTMEYISLSSAPKILLTDPASVKPGDILSQEVASAVADALASFFEKGGFGQILAREVEKKHYLESQQPRATSTSSDTATAKSLDTKIRLDEYSVLVNEVYADQSFQLQIGIAKRITSKEVGSPLLLELTSGQGPMSFWFSPKGASQRGVFLSSPLLPKSDSIQVFGDGTVHLVRNRPLANGAIRPEVVKSGKIQELVVKDRNALKPGLVISNKLAMKVLDFYLKDQPVNKVKAK